MGIVIKVSLNKKVWRDSSMEMFNGNCHPPIKNPVQTSKTHTKLHSTLAETVVYERLPPRRQKMKTDTQDCASTRT